MSSKSVKRLQLNEALLERLAKKNLHTCKDVLSLTRLEILNLLGISDKKREELIHIVSESCAPNPQTAYEIYQTRQRNAISGFFPLSLGDFDAVLHGGLPLGTITEISGPPGVGKTQFCFMLSVLATLPSSMGGLDGQVIYIDTESAFSAKRLMEIARTRVPEVYSSEEEMMIMMKRVFVHFASTTGALKHIIQKLEWEIIQKKVKLVILDSVASLVRKEFGTAEVISMVERTNLLVEQAALLKNLAESFGIVVLVTNQITTRFVSPSMHRASHEQRENEAETGSAVESSEEHVIPALGITWAHCVNTRLVAQFLDSNRRQLLVAKSPLAPNAAVTFTIQESGIVLEGENIEICVNGDPEVQKIQTRYKFLSP